MAKHDQPDNSAPSKSSSSEPPPETTRPGPATAATAAATPETTRPGPKTTATAKLKSAGRLAAKASRATVARIDEVTRSAQTAKVVADLEDRVWTFRRERKLGKGTLRATYIVAYYGYVSNHKAHIRVRVMEEPIIPPAASTLPNAAMVKTNIRRFVALAFPGVRVRISMGDLVADAITDRHGFATVQLPAINLEPGWADYQAVTMPVDTDEKPALTVGQVNVPDTACRFGVISDVDDTVLRTGMSEGMTAVRNTLFRSVGTRRAVPGMSTLYRALLTGPTAGKPSFYYVSTGPWNLYDMLTEFLRLRRFPTGPLFLTDWAPQERYILRSGQEHKLLTIQRLFEAYPDTKFILFGDSGQKDPDTYLELYREYPDNIELILIHDVGEHLADKAADLTEKSTQLRAQKIPFHFVEDAAAAAAVLRDAKLVTAETIELIGAAIKADEAGE